MVAPAAATVSLCLAALAVVQGSRYSRDPYSSDPYSGDDQYSHQSSVSSYYGSSVSSDSVFQDTLKTSTLYGPSRGGPAPSLEDMSDEERVELVAQAVKKLNSLDPNNEKHRERIQLIRSGLGKTMVRWTSKSCNAPLSRQPPRSSGWQPDKSKDDSDRASRIEAVFKQLARVTQNSNILRACFEPFMSSRHLIRSIRLLSQPFIRTHRQPLIAASMIKHDAFEQLKEFLATYSLDLPTLITWACSGGDEKVLKQLLLQCEKGPLAPIYVQLAQNGREDGLNVVHGLLGAPTSEKLCEMVVEAAGSGRRAFLQSLWKKYPKRMAAEMDGFFTQAVAKAGEVGNVSIIEDLFAHLPSGPHVINSSLRQEALAKGLRAAALNGNTEALKLLFQSSSKLAGQITPEIYDNVLEAGCQGGSIPVLEYWLFTVGNMLSLGWSVANHKISNEIFVAAAVEGHVDVIAYLQSLADLDSSRFGHLDVTFDDDRLLRIAAEYGRLTVLEYLLAEDEQGNFVHGVDPAAHNNEVVVHLCKNGAASLLGRLLTMTDASKFRIPNINPAVNDNQPLIEAASHGHLKVVELLLRQDDHANYVYPGIDAAARNNQALIKACEHGHLGVLTLLLTRDDNGYRYPGIDAGAQDNAALLAAAKNHHHAVLAKLVEVDGQRHNVHYLHQVNPQVLGTIDPKILAPSAETHELVDQLLNHPLQTPSKSRDPKPVQAPRITSQRGLRKRSTPLVPKRASKTKNSKKKALGLAAAGTVAAVGLGGAYAYATGNLPDVSVVVDPCIDGLAAAAGAVGQGVQHALEYAPSLADVTSTVQAVGGPVVECVKNYTPSLADVTSTVQAVGTPVVECVKNYTPSMADVTSTVQAVGGPVMECVKNYTPSMTDVTSVAQTVGDSVVQCAKDYTPTMAGVSQTASSAMQGVSGWAQNAWELAQPYLSSIANLW